MPITDVENDALKKLVYSKGWETFPVALETYLNGLVSSGTLRRQEAGGTTQYKFREDTDIRFQDDHKSYGERPPQSLFTKRVKIGLLVDSETIAAEGRENLRRIRRH